jgi:protein phosphatase
MVVCPNCQAENRSGAKFCKTCATRLPVSSSVTRPLDVDESQLLAAVAGGAGGALAQGDSGSSPTPPGGQATRRLNQNPRSGTRPLQPANNFVRRPPGAIFADNFLYENVIFSDEHQHRYLVHQIDAPEDMQMRVCPNPTCGATFLPRNAESERFCTDCGTVLEKGGKDLVLIEARTPIPDSVVRAAAKGLSHGAVRAPLAAFVERLAGVSRHCMVTPRVNGLDGAPDSLQALRWGIALARGLDYLHDNGVTFGGRVDAGHFGQIDERAVWANFSACTHHPEGYVTDRKPDALSLSTLIFHWLTGKTQFKHDPNLPAPVIQAFDTVFGSPGIASGQELADLLEHALEEIASVRTIDFIMGRRTHVGMMRSLNEDSLMSLEINRIHQSVSQPLGVYVVADGMGGHAAGEIASGAIINTISQKALKDLMPVQLAQGEAHDRSAWLRQAVESANAEVFNLRKSAGSDMGSTLVSAVLEGSRAYVTHVGDSRAYLVNGQGIQRLTVDHSLVERLVATHQISREEARFHPQRNVIYRTIGDKATVEVEISTHTLNVGDCLLLCSDGLSGMVDDETIRRVVTSAASPQDACDTLVRAANDAGGDDNISVIIVKLVEA